MYELHVIEDAFRGGVPSTQQARPGNLEPAQGPKIFISYAHEDAEVLVALKTQLVPYIRNRRFTVWYDSSVKAGSKWDAEIRRELEEADASILLVSPSFLASDYIFTSELPVLITKPLFWIPVTFSSFEETELGEYQALIPPDRPLSALNESDRDAAWVLICRTIAAALPPGRVDPYQVRTET